MTRVVIVSIPYTEPLPMVAPVLLSACLEKQGISAVGLDLGVEFLQEFVDRPYWPELKNLLALGMAPQSLPMVAVKDLIRFISKKLKQIQCDYNPEYLGLSIFTNESINFSYVMIPYIRRYLPQTKIMLGGRGLELICGVENRPHYEKYHDHGMADVCVVGDAETAIVEVVKQNITGIYFAQPQTREDLDNIPVPNWSNYNFDLYKKFENYKIAEGHDTPGEDPRYIAVTGSKGCVRNCSFCDVASFWPKYIYRDGEKIADEIIVNYQNTGIKNFGFTDNLINGSITHYRKMNQRLADVIPNTINYGGYAIFRSRAQMPESDFELAARAGCRHWVVGVESGSEKVRYDLKKKFSNDDLDHGVINLHKNNIGQSWLLIVGYPTETERDYLETENFIRRYAHLNGQGMIKVGITPTFQLLHNSPLIQDHDLRHSLGLEYTNVHHLSRYFWTTSVNPENTFETRYQRWMRLIELVQSLGYVWQPSMPVKKWADELASMKKIYDQQQPKKVFAIHRHPG